MYHTNAPANSRWTGLRSQDGRGKISSFNDSGSYRLENILTWDNASGNLGMGAGPSPFRLNLFTPSNSGLRVQTNIAGGAVASFGGFGDFQIDAPGVVGGRFAVRESGRVGIGTNSPLAALDLKGGADSDGSFDPVAMAFQYRGGGFRHWIRTRHNCILGSGNAIDFYVNNSTTPAGSSGPGLGSGSAHVMTPDSGRVGIRTPTPTERLSVAGLIQRTSGFKFPDESVQTTAAANATYTTVPGNFPEIEDSGPLTTILHLMNLPAGAYLLSATIEFHNSADFIAQDNTRRIYCHFVGQEAKSYSITMPPGGIYGYDLPITMHTVLDVSSGEVDIKCHGEGLNQNLVFVWNRRLTAVKLAGSVNVQ